MWRAAAAAAASKSLQSCPTLCDLIDSSPPGSPIPGILQAREWVAISFSKAWKWKVKVKSFSHVWLLATAAMGFFSIHGIFSRQEYWSGVPLPSPMWRANSLEKRLMLGKVGGRRRREWQRMRWLDGIIDSMDMSLSKFRKIVKDREAWHAAVHGVAKSQSWQWMNNSNKRPGYGAIKNILKSQWLVF